jgi:hypothetical protein
VTGRPGASQVHLDVQFTDAAAVEAQAHLDAEVDDLFHRWRKDHRATGGELALPSRAELVAQATLDLFRRGRANGHAGTGPVADVNLVVTTPPDLPSSLRRPADGEPEGEWLAGLLVTTLDGVPVRRSVARLLCCDPNLRVHVEDHHGEVLTHGRARRFANRAQRRAAAVRFGGCCFPGCDAPPTWADLHHVQRWDAGGSTDQQNLAPLCRRHHGVIHRRGWTMRPAPHGFDVTTPTGRTIPCRARSPEPVARP